MELDWSTFVLEIINFLVLLWLLRHFLYRPVLAAIARRQQNVQSQLEAAESIKTNADSLRAQYEQRMADWQQERDRQQAALETELQRARKSRFAELEKELEQARVRSREEDQRKLAETRASLEQAALEQGAAFASRLLAELASPQLESLLVDMALRYMREMSDDDWQMLQKGMQDGVQEAAVSSAFQLGSSQQQSVAEALGEKLNAPTPCSYRTDPSLISGLEIVLGNWVLAANLRDELRGFTGHLRHE